MRNWLVHKASSAVAVALAVWAITAPAAAQAPPEAGGAARSGLGLQLALASQYVDRGISLTRGKPALQGAVEFAFDYGLHLRVWGSNVELAPAAPEARGDFDVAIDRPLAQHFTWNTGVCYTAFSRSRFENAWEMRVGMRCEPILANLNPVLEMATLYSPDALGAPLYFVTSLSLALPMHGGLSCRAGNQRTDDALHCTDWEIALHKRVSNLEVTMAHTNTDLTDEPLSGARTIFSINWTH